MSRNHLRDSTIQSTPSSVTFQHQPSTYTHLPLPTILDHDAGLNFNKYKSQFEKGKTGGKLEAK